MAVIGIYDADFMNYEHVIPNLECAKLCTYHRNIKNIAVLVPKLEPARYTEFYIRKDYDDQLYPKGYFQENCVYGGRAFTPEKYVPLPDKIERTIPDMHIYDKYRTKFGHNATELQQIRHILNCAHIRLSTDNATPKSLNQLKSIVNTGKYTGIIFHDYDLAKIPQAYDIIHELSCTRSYITKKGINPYAIGNKFPINVYNSDELQKWLKIVSMPNLFSLQYNGLMNNTVMYNLCTQNQRMAKQVYYNITGACSSEEQFFKERLEEIFIQTLFLRRTGIKILLLYDNQIIITPELQTYIELLNCWLSFTYMEGFMRSTQTLATFVKAVKKFQYTKFAFRTVKLPIESIRDMFQYMREKNYDLFDKFYQAESVIYEGGRFIDEWSRYSQEN